MELLIVPAHTCSTLPRHAGACLSSRALLSVARRSTCTSRACPPLTRLPFLPRRRRHHRSAADRDRHARERRRLTATARQGHSLSRRAKAFLPRGARTACPLAPPLAPPPLVRPPPRPPAPSPLPSLGDRQYLRYFLEEPPNGVRVVPRVAGGCVEKKQLRALPPHRARLSPPPSAAPPQHGRSPPLASPPLPAPCAR